MTECRHPYRFPAAVPGTFFCPTCKVIIAEEAKEHKLLPLIMPQRLIELNVAWWKNNAPWKNISLELALKFDWYISFLSAGWYLIMPIKRDGKDVFYSARRLDKMNTFEGQKYMYPEGVDKHVFISGKVGRVVAVTEGVADATHVSPIITSAGLLGSYPIDELETLIPQSTKIITLFDGDAAGAAATVSFVRWCEDRGRSCYGHILPVGKDPTDLSPTHLRKIIDKYTRRMR